MSRVLNEHERDVILRKLINGDLEFVYGREEVRGVIYLTAKPTIIGRAHEIAESKNEQGYTQYTEFRP